MPWSVARAKSVPRAEDDHRAREARIALERLERALVAPPAVSLLRLALGGLALALRSRARSDEQPCRNADMMGTDDSMRSPYGAADGLELRPSMAVSRSAGQLSSPVRLGWRPRRRRVVVQAQAAVGHLDAEAETPTGNKRIRERRVHEVDCEGVVDDAAQARGRHCPVPCPAVLVEPRHDVG
jgi:hypothetical protein